MKELPKDVKPSDRTDVFTESTVPAGLLKDHRVMKGVWGKIVVLEGELRYTIQSDPPEVVLLNPDRFGVVEPQVYHHVTPQGKTRFYVEFHEKEEA